MEHDREPGMVEAGMESDSEWIWEMRNERRQEPFSSGAVFSRYRDKSYILANNRKFDAGRYESGWHHVIPTSLALAMGVFYVDFSLFRPLEFFVDPKNGDGRNNNPPAMRVRVDCYTKKLPFRVQ